MLPLEAHPGAGNRQAQIPLAMRETLRWVTTEFAVGDVLLFTALTVHAALHNASEVYLRLSVDFRYQQEGEELTALCLEPHFGRQSWEGIYAGWKSSRWQYYWKALDYRVVPFRDLPVQGAGPPKADGSALSASVEDAFRSAVASGAVELTRAQCSDLLRAATRREERSRRCLERGRALLAEREARGGGTKEV
jgi:hypothetical protein